MNSSEYESMSIAKSRCAGCCLACGICKILCYTVSQWILSSLSVKSVDLVARLLAMAIN